METSPTRFNGTLKTWNAQRGFGFVVAEQGGQELFVHVSALPRDGWIPVVGEPLTFEIELDPKDGRKRAVRVRRPGVPVTTAAAKARASRAEQARHQARRPPSHRAPSSSSFGARLIGWLLVAGLGWYGYAQYTERVDAASRAAAAAEPQGLMSSPMQPAAPQIQQQPASFHCDGRQYCSQMTSCSEAKLFLKNCPGMKMDGDGDGVPCEEQWCVGG
jgi:cold shock CspA family protein